MTTPFEWRRLLCVAGCVLAGGMAAGSAQSSFALSSLGVPPRSLPDGCALKPPDPEPTPIVPLAAGTASATAVTVVAESRKLFLFPSPFPSNPWLGTDYRLRLAVRRTIDGAGAAVRIPDAPPPSPREVAALESHWADDVVEGYRATYQTAAGGQIYVSAVRFTDPKWATADPPLAPLAASRGASVRVVRGATVILISGSSNTECFHAISLYLRSIK